MTMMTLCDLFIRIYFRIICLLDIQNDIYVFFFFRLLKRESIKMDDYNTEEGSTMVGITENPLDILPANSESSILNTPLMNVHSFESSEATISENTSDGPMIGYIISDENKWGWITLYVVTIVVAVLGNLLFIIGSLCTRRSRNTGHYLLINLSIRDILLAGLCIPATLDSEIIHLTWNLGLEFCISFR